MESVGKEVGFIPAQLRMWFILVSFLMMVAMKALQSGVEPMSKAEVRWSPGEQRARVEEREGPLMSVRARVAPSWESLMLVARPIPEPAPVMRTTLPVKGLDIAKVRGGRCIEMKINEI